VRTRYLSTTVENAEKRASGGRRFIQVAPKREQSRWEFVASIGRRRSQLAPVTLSNKRKNHETA
jgi:hypothetical protein